MDTANSIYWQLLNDTLEHYQGLSFKYIEVPWLVSEDAIRSTFRGHQDESYPGLYLVGSAEQSFVELLLQNKMDPKQHYVALSPCFRNEVVHNEFTKPYFMKVELFKPYLGDELDDYELASTAARWFHELVSRLAPKSSYDLRIKHTDEGYDININGVEVGSYGIRHYQGFSWVYGTGLAEPRFSTLMSKIRNSK